MGIGRGSVARRLTATAWAPLGSGAARLGMGSRVAMLGFRVCVVVDRRVRGVPRRVPPTILPPRRNCISGRMVVMEV